MVFTLPWNENSFTVNGQSSVIIYPCLLYTSDAADERFTV